MTPIKAAARTVSPVNARLDRKLTAYMAAAGAAGIGLLASPPRAEARVVYTPTNVSVGVQGGLLIDLNNDGITDFEIVGFRCGSRGNCIAANPSVTGNAIRAELYGANLVAAAGHFGVPVGPGAQFLSQFVQGSFGQSYVAFMAVGGAYGPSTFSGGPWAKSTNRYLGLKFLINGKVHYGWARMNVTILKNIVQLTGYAYETIPNQKIYAGHTQGQSASDISANDLRAPAPQPATLGALARGADALAIWRREEEKE